jgi:putative aldouronate transport system substrate-binding protein
MKRIFTGLMALLLVFALVACGQSAPPDGGAVTTGAAATDAAPTTTAAAAAATTAADAGKTGDGAAFTWFRPQVNRNAVVYWNDTLWIQELEKRMGVKINFEGPLATGTDYTQAVQILLNSGDYPDVLLNNWSTYSGGLAGAIKDGIVLSISDKPDYWALLPTWQKLQQSNDFIRRTTTLDDGVTAAFPHVEETTDRQCYSGYALRGDWLKQVGMDVPTTVDELYEVLKAFKGLKPEMYPLTDESGNTTLNNLMPAWGIKRNTTVPYPDPDNPGKITFWTLYKDGQAFTDFVTTMNKWYSEGLIDPDFSSQDWAARSTKMTTEASGFSYLLPQFYSSWRDAIVAANPEGSGDAYFIGLEPLIGPAGKKFNTNGFNSWAATGEDNTLTTAAEKNGNVEIILKVIDYLYSEDGSVLNSWGVEGVSFYVDENGKKQWSEAVTNDPDFNFGDAVFKYAIPTQGGWPKLMSYEAWLSQETRDPDAAKAHEAYKKGDPTLSMPAIRLTQEESEAYNQIMVDAVTLIDENFANFITGVRPLSDIPGVLKQLEDMGVRDALTIYQGAYDRYMSK